MARVNYVTKARASKTKRVCAIGGEVIEPGESYKFVDLKTGPVSGFTRYFCFRHHPRPSHTTANARMSTLYACQEALEDAITLYQNGEISYDDLQSEFNSQADEIESVAEEYEESKENMPENLQYSSVAEELEEKASSIREWAEAIRDINWDEVEEFEDDQCTYGDGAPCRQLEEADVHTPEHDDYDHDFIHELPVADISAAESAVGEFPL